MKNKKLIRFVESFVLLPIATMSIPASMPQAPYNIVSSSQIVLAQQNNAANDALNQKLVRDQAKADAIDAYFEAHDMPLAGTGMKMVTEAENNDLDWRLLAAIAVRESTGGKHDCKKVDNNPFGWGSCKIGFKSVDEAIETVARNLGGNNPKTANSYDDKTTIQILHAYNPPSVVPHYAEQVLAIMKAIGAPDAPAVVTATANS